MAANPMSGNIYWSDAQTRQIEVSDYDGQNRRTLISSGLLQPRSVVIDSSQGYVENISIFLDLRCRDVLVFTP